MYQKLASRFVIDSLLPKSGVHGGVATGSALLQRRMSASNTSNNQTRLMSVASRKRPPLLMPKQWGSVVQSMRKITFTTPAPRSGEDCIPARRSTMKKRLVVPRIEVYTDASVMKKKAGAAAVICFDGKQAVCDQLHLGAVFTSCQAEMWGVILGLQRLETLLNSTLWKSMLQREGAHHTVDLFVDWDRAVKILQEPANTKSEEHVVKLVRRYQRRFERSYPLVKINVQRIASRKGGNRLAHHKARGAAGEGGTNIATSIL